jgi:hypothetical protein
VASLKTRAAWRRRRGGLAAQLAVVLALLASPAAAGEHALEDAVKATYLYKFAPFVEWPAGAFEGAASALRICAVGSDGVAQLIGRAIADQRIGDRPVELRRGARPGGECHILYIAGLTPQSTAEILAAVRRTPVLTVTDGVQDARAKGIINFVIDRNRVRFEIDIQQAAENRLAISSKLLSLAVAVRQRDAG